MFDLVIDGGTVVTDRWMGQAAIAVQSGRIATIARGGDGTTLAARRTIDAEGCYVLPGGVDPHCHVADRHASPATLDDFATAGMAALAGGTTTIIPFGIPSPGNDPVTEADYKLGLGCEARCDFTLHGCIASDDTDIDATISAFLDRGIRTVKCFTTYQGIVKVGLDTIRSVMTALAPAGGLTYIHAEDDTRVDAAQKQLCGAGHCGAEYMAASRPADAEATAVRQVIDLAEQIAAPVYFVHQTTPDAIDAITSARARGVRAFAETCPHYLTLTDDLYLGPTPEYYTCCPSLHPQATVDSLVLRLGRGLIHTIGSDNCCFSTQQKKAARSDLTRMPHGMPGVETRVGVCWDAFVRTGVITPPEFVAMVSSTPARLAGLYPQKGSLLPGSDADIVVLDPQCAKTIMATDLHMPTDYTPFEGREVQGWPRTVIAAGTVVLDGDDLADPGPVGKFLPSRPVQVR